MLEPKLDGLRCIAVRNGREVSLFSRNRLPFTARFPTIVRAVASLPASNFVLDGEVVGMVDRRPNFGALQANIGGLEDDEAPSIEYWVFDLPWLLGQDLRHLPISERKNLLAKAVLDGGLIRLVPTLEGEAHERFCTRLRARLGGSCCQTFWIDLQRRTFVRMAQAQMQLPSGIGDRWFHRAARHQERFWRAVARLLATG